MKGLNDGLGKQVKVLHNEIQYYCDQAKLSKLLEQKRAKL